jgi:hypothetical protein
MAMSAACFTMCVQLMGSHPWAVLQVMASVPYGPDVLPELLVWLPTSNRVTAVAE